MNRKPTALRQMLVAALILTVSHVFTFVTTSAVAQTPQPAAGELLARGPVALNGTAAVPGVSVFSKSHVKTGPGGTATINVGKLGRIELGPEASLTLRFYENVIGGTLFSGRAVVSAPAGVGISLVTADGTATADGKQAAVLVADLTRGGLRVAAGRSNAQVISGNKVQSVAAGQEVSIGAASVNPAPSTASVIKSASRLSTGAIAGLIIAGVAGTAVGVGASKSSDRVSGEDPPVSQSKP